MRRRISKFPLHKPFEKQPPESAFRHITLRLIVGFNTESTYVIGTATVVCGGCLLTARHVIEDVLRRETVSGSEIPQIQNSLVALQTEPGPVYRLWQVLNVWLCPQTDLAFLQIASEPLTTAIKPGVQWKQPVVRAFPPAVGETVAAVGYRKSVVEISVNDQGGLHHDIKSELMVSVGVVREVFATQRDRKLLTFPCYQVSARFDGGMSGGPVFDETGALCGLVCLNVAGSHIDAEPISYVTTLWPMFFGKITADRGDAYPRGVTYPVFELARDNIITVTDYPELAAMQPKI